MPYAVTMLSTKDNFYDLAKDSKKILVLDLGFLGDTIHLIPALNIIRQSLPKAKLHVMVADHVVSILEVCPWIDKVLGYPRFPKGPKWYQDIGRVFNLRKEGYDTIINLNGSDRSSILTYASGARKRLGRLLPNRSSFIKHCFTHFVEYPVGKIPLYECRCECLFQAGFPRTDPRFNVTIPDKTAAKVQSLIKAEVSFIHVSPFTTLDYKELPEACLSDFLNQLNYQFPEYNLVISCAPNEREQSKLTSLLSKLKFKPAKVFCGELNLIELAGVIEASKLHIGGDSGALHVGLMAGRPTLSWFREYENMADWTPRGKQHRVLVGEASPEGLKGISAKALMESACFIL